MADVEMTIIVKDDELKAGAEEDLRELIDTGRAEIYTFEEFDAHLVKIFGPRLDAAIAANLKAKGGEPEAEEEIEVPDAGDVIAEAALEAWHRKPGGLKPRKPAKKPDPPELHTSEDLELIPPPEDDFREATRRTWRKGWGSIFGKDKK